MVESPFVGASRRALVDGLLTLFKEVSAGEQPKWVSLELPPAWGKTRVVLEFYRRLAKEQEFPQYWPQSMTGEDLDGVCSRRKRVSPSRFVVPAGAVPAWAWLGVLCQVHPETGAGMPVLLESVQQWETHSDSFRDRWRQVATRSVRAKEWINKQSSRAQDIAAEAVGSLVPGFGFGRIAIQAVVDSVQEGRERLSRRASDRPMDVTERNAEVAAKLARDVIEMAVPGLPVVIFVEDLHAADPSLVEFLRSCITAPKGAVMVITTCWPGQLEGNDSLDPLEALTANSKGNCVRVADNIPLSGIFAGINLNELPVADRHTLVAGLLPEADQLSHALIAERFTNPYALELFCQLLTNRNTSRGAGAVTSVDPADVDSAPTGLSELLERVWESLPEEVKIALRLAALGSPVAISPDWSAGDDRWHSTAVLEAIADSGLIVTELDRLGEDLDRQQTAYGWARAVDEWLRRFIEPEQRHIAADQKRHPQILESDIRQFRTLLAQRIQTQLYEDTDDATVHRARTILALHAEGFINGPPVASAALKILNADPYLRPAEQLRIANTGLKATPEHDTPDALEMRHYQALAHCEAGQLRDAITLYRALLKDQERVLGDEDADTLMTRSYLAYSLGEAGQVDEAIATLRTLLEDRTRILTANHSHTLSTRRDLARWLGEAGQIEEAISMFRALLEDQERVLGDDDPETLETRGGLARWLGWSGQADEAIALSWVLLEDETRILGADDPSTLMTRSNLAYALGDADRIDEAVDVYRALLKDQERVLGDEHPETLITRNNIAHLLGEAGQVDEAIAMHRALLEDRTRILGADHPDTLTSRGNIAGLAAKSDQPQHAITTYQTLLEDRRRVMGDEHPDTLNTRSHLAFWVGRSGQVDEAIAMFQALLNDQTRILGADHPDTLNTQSILDYWLERSRED